MSLWKFGDFEADVDFTDADFLDAIDKAKAAMHEAEQNVPVVGKNSPRAVRVFLCVLRYPVWRGSRGADPLRKEQHQAV